ncbi:hypothetical protein HK104_001416 [Borealophlyctis nickersoniae]|nr:hypothetical protein HK104_001416 [Borealophlyctis nickersoniae]
MATPRITEAASTGCESSYDEIKVADVLFPNKQAEDVYAAMCEGDNPVVRKFHELKGSTGSHFPSTDRAIDVVRGCPNAYCRLVPCPELYIGPWEDHPPETPGETALARREVKYWVPVSHPLVKARTAEALEIQFIIEKRFEYYILEIHTVTQDMPYGDDFIPMLRFCISQHDPLHARLLVSIWIRWIKKPKMVASIIDCAAKAGLKDTAEKYVQAFESVLGRTERLGERV